MHKKRAERKAANRSRGTKTLAPTNRTSMERLGRAVHRSGQELPVITKYSDWARLPRDVLSKIADYLDVEKDKGAMRATCKEWLAEVTGTIRRLTPSGGPRYGFTYGHLQNSHLSLLIPNFKNLESVVMSRCDFIDEVGMGALAHVNGLKKLEVTKSEWLCANTASWLPIIKHMDTLTSLKLEMLDNSSETLQQMSQLTHLDLQYSLGLDNESIGTLGTLTALQVLNIAGSKVKHGGLATLLSRLPDLTELHLSGCPSLSGSALETLKRLPNPHKLQVLHIARLKRLASYHLEELKDLSGLSTLDLSLNQAVTDESVKFIVGLHDLRYLSLAGCPNLGDMGVMELSLCPNLESLNLECCANVSDLGAEHLLNVPSLQYLNAQGLDVCKQTLKRLSRGLKVLIAASHSKVDTSCLSTMMSN